MAIQVQLRRGNETDNDALTGAQGELTFDTTNNQIRVHDGSTAGGHPIGSGLTNTSPNLLLTNTSTEDTDGGRESLVTFKGKQSGGELSTLAQIQASHDGTSDDEKGDLIFRTNDGSDGASPTERMRIDSAGLVTITNASNDAQLRLESTDADASFGPKLNMYRNSSSPADDDLLGNIEFEGRNDNSQDVVYGRLFSKISDASDGTEDGIIRFDLMKGGSLSDVLTFNPDELIVNDGSFDYNFRVESNDNANMLFVDAGNNTVGIGTAAPSPTGLAIVTGGGAKGVLLARNDGSGSPTSGQGFGSFAFKGINDGSNSIAAAEASIEAIAAENHSGSTAATSLAFYTKPSGTGPGSGPTERMRVLASGGLTFNGDTSASNALNDYEEGTFTPTISCGSGLATLSASEDIATYTKIGRMVMVQGRVLIGAISSPSSSLIVSNLPFAVGNAGEGALPGAVAGALYDLNSSITGAINAEMHSQGILFRDNGATTGGVTNMADHIKVGTRIGFTAMYIIV